MIKIFIIQFLLIVASLFGGCQDEGTGWTPDMIPNENLPSDDDDDDDDWDDDWDDDGDQDDDNDDWDD